MIKWARAQPSTALHAPVRTASTCSTKPRPARELSAGDVACHRPTAEGGRRASLPAASCAPSHISGGEACSWCQRASTSRNWAAIAAKSRGPFGKPKERGGVPQDWRLTTDWRAAIGANQRQRREVGCPESVILPSVRTRSLAWQPRGTRAMLDMSMLQQIGWVEASIAVV